MDADAATDYASWGSRVGASLLDSIVVSVGFLATTFLGLGIASFTHHAVVLVALAIAAVVWLFGYFIYFEGGETGQTLGKRAASIRVRNDEGARASYGQAFGRRLVAAIMNILWPIGLVDVLWPLWDDRKQCLHDKAASTIVVRA